MWRSVSSLFSPPVLLCAGGEFSFRSSKTNKLAMHMTIKSKQTACEAILPLSLFRRLKSCEVSCLSRDSKGEVLEAVRSYRGRELRSSLTVSIVSATEEFAHRVAALLLLQVGGRASFYRSGNLGGVVARISLPLGVHFVVEDC